jgi:hypothetical protein
MQLRLFVFTRIDLPWTCARFTSNISSSLHMPVYRVHRGFGQPAPFRITRPCVSWRAPSLVLRLDGHLKVDWPRWLTPPKLEGMRAPSASGTTREPSVQAQKGQAASSDVLPDLILAKDS